MALTAPNQAWAGDTTCNARMGAFLSGGVQGDRIREIYGNIGSIYGNRGNPGSVFSFIFDRDLISGGSSGYRPEQFFAEFVAGNVVPTGADNAPKNLSARLWLRIN
jgi:hypothetical protein